MEIVVNHLTRMYPGYICVAGVNTSTWQHIRPVLNGRLSTSLLAANGGPFAMASHVDLGSVQYRGCPPEVEDYYFSSQNVRAIRILPPEEFWELLQHIARRSIVEIFGSAIRSYGKGCVVEVETGEASLGCLIPATQPKLFVNSFGSVRVGVTDGTSTLDLSVTDVRLCEVDHKTLKMGLINQINSRMQRGTPVILSIGLTRSWQKPGDTKEWHWLQVNNIHLKDSVV